MRIPQSLVPVQYNLTAEVPDPTDTNNTAEAGKGEGETTKHGNGIGDVLFQGAAWGYIGARSVIAPVPGGVQDMVATLEMGMGM